MEGDTIFLGRITIGAARISSVSQPRLRDMNNLQVKHWNLYLSKTVLCHSANCVGARSSLLILRRSHVGVEAVTGMESAGIYILVGVWLIPSEHFGIVHIQVCSPLHQEFTMENPELMRVWTVGRLRNIQIIKEIYYFWTLNTNHDDWSCFTFLASNPQRSFAASLKGCRVFNIYQPGNCLCLFLKRCSFAQTTVWLLSVIPTGFFFFVFFLEPLSQMLKGEELYFQQIRVSSLGRIGIIPDTAPAPSHQSLTSPNEMIRNLFSSE